MEQEKSVVYICRNILKRSMEGKDVTLQADVVGFRTLQQIGHSTKQNRISLTGREQIARPSQS